MSLKAIMRPLREPWARTGKIARDMGSFSRKVFLKEVPQSRRRRRNSRTRRKRRSRKRRGTGQLGSF